MCEYSTPYLVARHGVGLAAAGLAIGEERGVDAVPRAGEDGGAEVLKDVHLCLVVVGLTGARVEDAVVPKWPRRRRRRR